MVSFLNLVNSVRLIFLLKMPKFPDLQADFEIWVKYSFLSPKVRYGLVWLVGWLGTNPLCNSDVRKGVQMSVHLAKFCSSERLVLPMV